MIGIFFKTILGLVVGVAVLGFAVDKFEDEDPDFDFDEKDFEDEE